MNDPVEQQTDAYSRRDLEAFLDAYHDDARIENGMGEPIMTGKDAMREQYGKLFESSPDLACEVEIHWSSPNWIINEEKITGMQGEGAPEELHAMVAYKVTDGKISFVRMFV